jgi:hypothetical protein
MRRRLFAALVLCALLAAFATPPASAATGATAGPCEFVGKWRLTVSPYDATHLVVVFVVRGQDPGSVWQLFGSDDGHAFVPRTKSADQYGVVRARWRPIDRAGADDINAAGSTSGNSCTGSISY